MSLWLLPLQLVGATRAIAAPGGPGGESEVRVWIDAGRHRVSLGKKPPQITS